MKQQQFLEVLDRDEAERRWRAVIDVAPLRRRDACRSSRRSAGCSPRTCVPRSTCRASIARTWTASRCAPRTPSAPARRSRVRLRLNAETIPTGVAPRLEVAPGTATPIATGGMLPARRRRGGARRVHRRRGRRADRCDARACPAPRSPLRAPTSAAARRCSSRGTRLTSRETGVLAAIGRQRGARSCGGPVVAILSTGDEIVQPGEAMRPGLVYDSNGRILADAVPELGGEPRFLGVFRDDEAALRAALHQALGRGRPGAALGRHLEGGGRPQRPGRGRARARASWSTAWRSSPASRSASPPAVAARS